MKRKVLEMYVRELVELDLIGTVKSVASWQEIEAAIRLIDGESRTALLLRKDKESADMTIAGGRESSYHVFIGKLGQAPLNLVNPDADDDELEMVICGQGTTFEMWQLVGFGQVVQAARWFSESGEAEPSLHWFRGGSRDWHRSKRV